MAIMDDDEVASDLSFTSRILLWGHDTLSTRDGLTNIQVSMLARNLALDLDRRN